MKYLSTKYYIILCKLYHFAKYLSLLNIMYSHETNRTYQFCNNFPKYIDGDKASSVFPASSYLQRDVWPVPYSGEPFDYGFGTPGPSVIPRTGFLSSSFISTSSVSKMLLIGYSVSVLPKRTVPAIAGTTPNRFSSCSKI